MILITLFRYIHYNSSFLRISIIQRVILDQKWLLVSFHAVKNRYQAHDRHQDRTGSEDRNQYHNKLFLVFPTGDTNLSNEHLDMLQIDCLVTGTKAISLSRIVEQDDDEVRVEIEV